MYVHVRRETLGIISVLRRILLHRRYTRGSVHICGGDIPLPLSMQCYIYFQDLIHIWGILRYLWCFQDSGFVTLPIWNIPPATISLSIEYIGVTLVSLPRYRMG